MAATVGGETPAQTEEDAPDETATEEQATATATPSEQVVVDDEIDLDVNGHESYRMYYDSGFRISYEFEVTSGPNIDVFVLSHSELDHYESGRLFETVTESMDASEGSGSAEVSSGTYYVVVDHSEAGEADPQSGIDQEGVSVQIRATSERVS